MRVDEFEKAVFDLEEIQIRIRAPAGEQIGDYNFQRQDAQTTSVTEWLRNRIIPLLNGHEVSVIDGNFKKPHGTTHLRTLRDSY